MRSSLQSRWWGTSDAILFIVCFKEIIDNLRDRRSLLTSVMLIPVLMPVFMMFLIGFQLERQF